MRVKFSSRTIRKELSNRGGGIEISLDGLKKNRYKGQKMTAYQNYLGGGMLGFVGNDCTLNGWWKDKYLVRLAEDLAKHFLKECHGSDEGFEELQKRPVSAY